MTLAPVTLEQLERAEKAMSEKLATHVSVLSIDVPVGHAHLIHSIMPVDKPIIVRFLGQEVLLQVGERAYLKAGNILVVEPTYSTPDDAGS